ncbi:mitogen-activated protein kinase kinase kinase 18-like [Abrus precatorius]|uniref:mitogen-activated protein kinase kinase kinase n=1 Tax=Abrus precatorius TaxID=3816 RepID=A0A8B8L0R3_ABRPR|nr:mitogen-activated protein kinase kinase kinase 18-like [Abrus precatorius]
MVWNRGHTIGHGSTATVSIATCCGGVFAVKSSELSQSEPLKKEQTILSSLSSPYVVTYKGCDITMENNKLMFNFFMEYMPFGTLLQATRRHGGRIKEPVIKCYTRQIMQGLEYLHSKGLVHCDIKGANILIGEDGAKIGDFGYAKGAADAAAPICGTPMFMAPEVARGEEQGCPSDVWSLGCTVIEMATGSAPWPNVADPFSVLYHIAYSGEVPEIPCFLSEEAKDFLGKCLRRNPQERWTASELLKHPFLGEFCSNSNKQVLESNSSSPKSVLEQGFWSCVEESENFGNFVHTKSFEISAIGRVRSLALCSGVPCWARHHDDGDDDDWITTRRNEGGVEVEGFDNCGSETASTTSDGLAPKRLVKSNVSGRISGHVRQDHICMSASVVVSDLNFDRGIAKMPFPSIIDSL